MSQRVRLGLGLGVAKHSLAALIVPSIEGSLKDRKTSLCVLPEMM